MLKEKFKFILDQALFSKNTSSEAGSSLIYVLIITAIGSSLAAITTSRASNFQSQADNLKANAFVKSTLTDLNSQLMCPGGAIRVKRGSCSPNAKSITLSIRELRRIAMEKTSLSLATTGGMPQANRAYDYFDLLHMRIVCYKQGSHLDASGQAMKTDKKQIPCTMLGNIDQALSPLVFPNRLSGVEEQFNQDVAVILGTIIPDINQKIENIEKEIRKIEIKQKVAEQHQSITQNRLNEANTRMKGTQDAFQYSMNQYNETVRAYNSVAANCSPSCPSDSPFIPEIHAAYGRVVAAGDQWNRSYTALANTSADFRVADNENNLARSEVQGCIDAIATERRRISSYQVMTQYLKSISDGKDLILRNSQLAVLQAEGGILKHLLRHGVGGAATSALSRLPNSDNNGLSTSQTSPEAADDINLGLIQLRPFCSIDDGEARLRFLAKVTDVDFIGGALHFQTDYLRRRDALSKALKSAGFKSENGWMKMPVNFTPSGCKLIEEDDPPLAGKDNWKADGVKSARTKQ